MLFHRCDKLVAENIGAVDMISISAKKPKPGYVRYKFFSAETNFRKDCIRYVVKLPIYQNVLKPPISLTLVFIRRLL